MSGKEAKRKVLAFAWFTLNNKAMQIGFLDSDGKIDKDKAYVCFVPDLIDVFSGFKRSVKVARAICVLIERVFGHIVDWRELEELIEGSPISKK